MYTSLPFSSRKQLSVICNACTCINSLPMTKCLQLSLHCTDMRIRHARVRVNSALMQNTSGESWTRPCKGAQFWTRHQTPFKPDEDPRHQHSAFFCRVCVCGCFYQNVEYSYARRCKACERVEATGAVVHYAPAADWLSPQSVQYQFVLPLYCRKIISCNF